MSESDAKDPTKNLDQRRQFLFEATSDLGIFLKNPVAGLLSSLWGEGPLTARAERLEAKRQRPPFQPLMWDAFLPEQQWQLPSSVQIKKILVSGEPMNIQGHGFGTAGGAPVVLPRQGISASENAWVVIPHGMPHIPSWVQQVCSSVSEREYKEQQNVGASLLDFQLDFVFGWRQNLESHDNRRLTAQHPAVVTNPTTPALETQGLWGVNNALATPWNTLLFAEGDWQRCWQAWPVLREKENSDASQFGMVAEYNPATGLLVKQGALGRLAPQAMALVTQPGQGVVLYLLSHKLYKFVGAKPYDPRQSSGGYEFLSQGELFAADFTERKWISLREQPEGGSAFEQIACGGKSLAWASTSQTLLATWGGRIWRLHESQGEGFEIENLPLENLKVKQLTLDSHEDGWLVCESEKAPHNALILFLTLPACRLRNHKYFLFGKGPEQLKLCIMPHDSSILAVTTDQEHQAQLWLLSDVCTARSKASK